MSIVGKIAKKGFGFGVWALVTEDNTTYQLYEPVSELQKEGIAVEVEGKIREDIMTTAMIGAVLEVESFKLL